MSEQPTPPVEVPMSSISTEALDKIIDHFILREGTDYGATELPHESKVARVKKQLAAGKIKIVYDPNDETVSLMNEIDWKKQISLLNQNLN